MPSSVINSDDGVISGTSGLKSSGGDDGVLVFQSKGTETARINTDKQIVAAAGTASLPALTTTGDVNTGIFFPAADTIAFGEGGAEAMRIDSSGNVGIGTTSPAGPLDVAGNDGITVRRPGQTNGFLLRPTGTGDGVRFTQEGTGDRMIIDSSGNLLVKKTSFNFQTAGFQVQQSSGETVATRASGTPLVVNRLTNDGQLVGFYQDSIQEGEITVSGSTVSYLGGNLARWAQLTTPKDETTLLKGTVMSNLDEMNVYIAPTTYWTEEDELPEGVNVGDVKVETHEVQNEQLNKVKVSDVEGDANVAGVFVNWTYDEAHQVDEINMAMTGDMIIRIAQGVTVARGDLLMSAGDGTAKPQGDDIVRSKTIAKVTSTHVTCTYDDGSYCVPCVLMAC